MAKTPKDEQDFFGHWLSDNGWMFDTDSEDIWLNVGKGTFAHTAELYGLYISDSLYRTDKAEPQTYTIGQAEADYTVTSTFID